MRVDAPIFIPSRNRTETPVRETPPRPLETLDDHPTDSLSASPVDSTLTSPATSDDDTAPRRLPQTPILVGDLIDALAQTFPHRSPDDARLAALTLPPAILSRLAQSVTRLESQTQTPAARTLLDTSLRRLCAVRAGDCPISPLALHVELCAAERPGLRKHHTLATDLLDQLACEITPQTFRFGSPANIDPDRLEKLIEAFLTPPHGATLAELDTAIAALREHDHSRLDDTTAGALLDAARQSTAALLHDEKTLATSLDILGLAADSPLAHAIETALRTQSSSRAARATPCLKALRGLPENERDALIARLFREDIKLQPALQQHLAQLRTDARARPQHLARLIEPIIDHLRPAARKNIEARETALRKAAKQEEEKLLESAITLASNSRSDRSTSNDRGRALQQMLATISPERTPKARRSALKRYLGNLSAPALHTLLEDAHNYQSAKIAGKLETNFPQDCIQQEIWIERFFDLIKELCGTPRLPTPMEQIALWMAPQILRARERGEIRGGDDQSFIRLASLCLDEWALISRNAVEDIFAKRKKGPIHSADADVLNEKIWQNSRDNYASVESLLSSIPELGDAIFDCWASILEQFATRLPAGEPAQMTPENLVRLQPLIGLYYAELAGRLGPRLAAFGKPEVNSAATQASLIARACFFSDALRSPAAYVAHALLDALLHTEPPASGLA